MSFPVIETEIGCSWQHPLPPGEVGLKVLRLESVGEVDVARDFLSSGIPIANEDDGSHFPVSICLLALSQGAQKRSLQVFSGRR